MSSQETRGYIHRQQDYYLTPLSRVGKVPELINQWVKQVRTGPQPGQEIVRVDSEGKSRQIATGYELSRSQQIKLGQEELSWSERVLLVHSEVAQQQQQINPLQSKILTFLGLSPEIYSGLVENST